MELTYLEALVLCVFSLGCCAPAIATERINDIWRQS